MAPRSTTSRSLQFLSNTQEETEDLSGTVFSRTLCVHGCEATSGFGTKLTQRVPTTWHQHYTVLINAEPIFWWSLLVSIIVSQAEVSQKNCRIDILSHPEYKAEHGNTSHLRKHLVKLQIHLTESWTLWHEQHLHLYVVLLFFVCTHVRFDQSRWLKNKTITGASGEVKRTSGWHGGESTAPHRKGIDSNRTQQNMWAGAAVWRSYLHTCNMYCI